MTVCALCITLFLLKESLQNFKRYVICYLDFFIVDRRHLFGEKHFPKEPRKGYAFDICAGMPPVKGFNYVYCYVDMCIVTPSTY